MYRLSKDYERLYDLICQGHKASGWADSGISGSVSRDPVEVKRRNNSSIVIGARGCEYGGVYEFELGRGRDEKELFIDACTNCDLAYIEPSTEIESEEA